MSNLANLALDGGDPRLPPPEYEKEAELFAAPDVGGVKPQQRRIHDPTITFEEYHYYAKKTRAEEALHPATGHETTLLSLIFPSKSDGGVVQRRSSDGSNGGNTKRNLSHPEVRASVSDEEWNNASRALRTATRGAVFYLITTDILGPFALPYAFATMGWG
jgi:hypothetical protein